MTQCMSNIKVLLDRMDGVLTPTCIGLLRSWLIHLTQMRHGLRRNKNVIAIRHRRVADCIGIGMVVLSVILALCWLAGIVMANTLEIDTKYMLRIPN